MNTIRNNEYLTNNDELIEIELIRKEHMKGLIIRARVLNGLKTAKNQQNISLHLKNEII